VPGSAWPPPLARASRACLVFATLAAALSAAVPATAQAAAVPCERAYSYAGVVESRTASGVMATVTALESPQVSLGHVAGWVGVGGPRAGPHGETEWIQIGVSSFAGGESILYYELVQPGGRPRYTSLGPVRPGEEHRLGVAEVRGRPNWWRVWVDGRAVTEPVLLPGSHRRWQPVATAESWNAGQGDCNRFAYRFANVTVASRGRWRPLRAGHELEDPGYRVSRRSRGFVATATA